MAIIYQFKMKLDYKSSLGRNTLSNDYEIHKILCRILGTSRNEANILYRRNKDSILVHSTIEPKNFDEFSDIIKYKPKVNSIDYTHIKNGNVFRFLLKANPIKKRNGKASALIRKDDQTEWIKRTFGDNGLELLALHYVQSHGMSGVYKKDYPPIKFISATFSGILKIKDKDKCIGLLESGVGKEKAFGCGLLSIFL